MGITHLSGLEVGGVPTIGVGGLLPFGGQYFYVNETTGSDGNTGAADNPFKTLTQALAKATAGNNDVIFLTGTVHTTATTNWSKNNTHLIGLTASSNNDRARISQTGSIVFSPLVNVTAEGCIFANIGTFHGFNDASTQICWADAGGRNYYKYVQFLGMGNATAAAQAGSRNLTIGGDGENRFEDCTFGLDTVVRATNANASVEIISGSPRNIIRNGLFQSDCSLATDVHVKIAANGMDRYLILDNCVFSNFGGTSLNAAIANAGGSPAGNVIVTPTCISIGAAAIATTGNVYVGQISSAGATTTNIGILAT